MKKIAVSFSLCAAGLLFAIVFGLWSRSLTTISESVHFRVNFPVRAGSSSGESASSGLTDDCHGEGGEVASEDSDSDSGEQNSSASGSRWGGPPSVGGVAGTEGYLLIDLGQEGLLKRLIQPRFVNISTHWLRNVGRRPYKIRLEMDLCDIEMEWDTPEAEWDQATQSTTRYINPGTTFNMDWNLNIPPDMMQQAVICRGQLKVLDAEAGDLLTVLPVTIFNSRAN